MRNPKSTLDLISLKDRETLANWYGSDAHKAWERLADANRKTLMEAHVGQLEMGQVRFLTGGVSSLNKLKKDLEVNYKSKQDS